MFLEKQLKKEDTPPDVTPKKGDKSQSGGGDTGELVMYEGSMLDIASMMGRLDKSEKTRTEMEKRMQTLDKDKGTHIFTHYVFSTVSHIHCIQDGRQFEF